MTEPAPVGETQIDISKASDSEPTYTFHWFSGREEANGLKIDYQKFGEQAEEFEDDAKALIKYINLPAIEDSFPPGDMAREAWLKTRPKEFQEMYDRNRLRTNQVTPVLFNMQYIYSKLIPIDPDAAFEIRNFNEDAWNALRKESRKRTVEFADLIAEKALDTLKLLAEYKPK